MRKLPVGVNPYACGMDSIRVREFVWPAFLAARICLFAMLAGCDSKNAPMIATPTATAVLELEDVQTILAHAVEQAERLGVKANIAVTDREANVLGVFAMTGTSGTAENAILGSIAKARSAAYLSSNQHGFSTLTACGITRNHFPPGIENAAAGPLFGVPRSSLGGSDIQPNNGAVLGAGTGTEIGLTGVPGGVPIFKNGLLAGGVGVSGDPPQQSDLDAILCCCNAVIPDEIIALGAVLGGYETPGQLRGDGIFIDGIRFPFANAAPPRADFTLTFTDVNSRGAIDSRFPFQATPPAKFPVQGEVNLGIVNGINYDFSIKDGSALNAAEVQRIIDQAAAQAAKTRAAIRRPPGVPAQVFIAVVDVDGKTVLGISRTPDATFFSYDVSAQKARTALACSDPNQPLGQMVRRELGLPLTQGLAMTTRAVGFLAQDFYPPGISREEQALDRPIAPGPFFIPPPKPQNGDEFLFQKSLGLQPYGNGITIFPGGIPLYKNGGLAGAIGISGDGVDQDDIIAFAGTKGFEPPEEIRCDRIFYLDARLPFVKFPRQPELP